MEKEHLEIILEDIRGKFDLVLEGHDVLHKEIRDTRQELCEKISLVDFKVDALSESVEGIDHKVDGLSQRVDGLDQKVDGLSQKVDGLDQKVDGLSQRVDGLDQKVDGLSQKMDGVATDLKAHRTDTEVHRPVFRVKE
jgi:outer membrane murein-binding lipoprotein Lpp